MFEVILTGFMPKCRLQLLNDLGINYYIFLVVKNNIFILHGLICMYYHSKDHLVVAFGYTLR